MVKNCLSHMHGHTLALNTLENACKNERVTYVILLSYSVIWCFHTSAQIQIPAIPARRKVSKKIGQES